MPDILDIGEAARFAFVFADGDDALETPTSVTTTLRHPSYPTTADTTLTDSDGSITLGKVFPLSVRESLARRLGIDGITAASLAAGVGCVEYTHTVTEAGLYQAKCDDGAGKVEQTRIEVRPDFT